MPAPAVAHRLLSPPILMPSLHIIGEKDYIRQVHTLIAASAEECPPDPCVYQRTLHRAPAKWHNETTISADPCLDSALSAVCSAGTPCSWGAHVKTVYANTTL